MRPVKVFLKPQFVMVWKFVMTTSSVGIIMSARKPVNTRFLPLNSSRAKAKAANVITTIMSAVVTSVKIRVFPK